MFNMDFKSDGISWVGNIYQKFEAICQEVDGIMIQVCIIFLVKARPKPVNSALELLPSP